MTGQQIQSLWKMQPHVYPNQGVGICLRFPTPATSKSTKTSAGDRWGKVGRLGSCSSAGMGRVVGSWHCGRAGPRWELPSVPGESLWSSANSSRDLGWVQSPSASQHHRAGGFRPIPNRRQLQKTRISQPHPRNAHGEMNPRRERG